MEIFTDGLDITVIGIEHLLDCIDDIIVNNLGSGQSCEIVDDGGKVLGRDFQCLGIVLNRPFLLVVITENIEEFCEDTILFGIIRVRYIGRWLDE